MSPASPQAAASALQVSRGGVSIGVDEGRFSMLTYNVAGLPQLISGSDPAVNLALVSPLLNHYDLVLVQEDFAYHAELAANALHEYRSEPMRDRHAFMPDGLNRFSRFALGWVHRVRWARCSGYLGSASDCLADKGFSFSQLTLADGLSVDVYNLHAEAGSQPGDVAARRSNFEQLARYLADRSEGRPVIVAGDSNLRMSIPGDAATLSWFLGATGLDDACRSFGCGEERLDRVLLRGSGHVALRVLGWWTDRRFVDPEGSALSDHPAVGVELGWERQGEPPLVAVGG
jgi:endonuclease/exonuclease/phosphatase family metal-dependent hydrolase